MPRQEPPAPVALTAEDLRSYIASQDDFAFEREVYHKAKGLGMEAAHAGLYDDPVTNKPRQFDVRAAKTIGGHRICLTLECKGLAPTFPLLVSCVPRALGEGYHELLHRDNVPGNNNSYTRVQQKTGQRWLYKPGQKVGKAMRQVKRDTRGELIGGDEVFDKYMQAMASAAEVIAISAEQLSVPNTVRPRYVAVLPVLVVSDGTLWVADYESNGRISEDPFQVDDIAFFLGRKYQMTREIMTFTISHLHIYTRTGINTLLDQAANGGGLWQELFDLPDGWPNQ